MRGRRYFKGTRKERGNIIKTGLHVAQEQRGKKVLGREMGLVWGRGTNKSKYISKQHGETL